jgi:hypothetical protein
MPDPAPLSIAFLLYRTIAEPRQELLGAGHVELHYSAACLLYPRGPAE